MGLHSNLILSEFRGEKRCTMPPAFSCIIAHSLVDTQNASHLAFLCSQLQASPRREGQFTRHLGHHRRNSARPQGLFGRRQHCLLIRHPHQEHMTRITKQRQAIRVKPLSPPLFNKPHSRPLIQLHTNATGNCGKDSSALPGHLMCPPAPQRKGFIKPLIHDTLQERT